MVFTNVSFKVNAVTSLKEYHDSSNNSYKGRCTMFSHVILFTSGRISALPVSQSRRFMEPGGSYRLDSLHWSNSSLCFLFLFVSFVYKCDWFSSLFVVAPSIVWKKNYCVHPLLVFLRGMVCCNFINKLFLFLKSKQIFNKIKYKVVSPTLSHITRSCTKTNIIHLQYNFVIP